MVHLTSPGASTKLLLLTLACPNWPIDASIPPPHRLLLFLSSEGRRENRRGFATESPRPDRSSNRAHTRLRDSHGPCRPWREEPGVGRRSCQSEQGTRRS